MSLDDCVFEGVFMNKWILALLLLGSFQAYAATPADDLDAEVETEQMDVYDQKAMEEQARKEAKELERQTRQLEAQIKQLRKEGNSLNQRIDFQGERFQKTLRLAQETERKAKLLEGQRDALKHQLDNMQTRTQTQKQRLDTAQEMEANLNKELQEQYREKAQLTNKLKQAELSIERSTRAMKLKRERLQKLSKDNRRLQERVATAELRAKRIRN